MYGDRYALICIFLNIKTLLSVYKNTIQKNFLVILQNLSNILGNKMMLIKMLSTKNCHLAISKNFQPDKYKSMY